MNVRKQTSKIIPIDGTNINLKIGDFVNVSEPKYNNSFHDFAFSGTIVEFDDAGCIVVEDADGECFSIEDDEIESV